MSFVLNDANIQQMSFLDYYPNLTKVLKIDGPYRQIHEMQAVQQQPL